MSLVDTLERLCDPVAAPGREEEAARVIREMLEPFAHKLEQDRAGNLTAWLNPEAPARVMFDAHMDEVGFIVQRVDEKGFISVAPLGGLEAKVMAGSQVWLESAPGGRLAGVIGMAPPHVTKSGDAAKAVKWEDLFVDAGFSGPEEAQEAGVNVGTVGVPAAPFLRLAGGTVSARNLDDRAGCAILVELVKALAKDPPPHALAVNFSIAEEVGLRGATTAAFRLKPDLALVVEATVGETPGLPPVKQPSALGRGPAVTVADGRQVVPRRLVDSLENAAKAAGIPCQRKVPPYGGTNGGAIALAGSGVPTAVLSVPTRYIHTPVSLMRISDFEHTFALVKAWATRAGDLL